MTNPIVKIALPGKTIDSTDIRDYAFISSNTCNKLDSVKSDSIVINVGDTSGSVTIPHQLGYPCEFDVYEFDGSGYTLWPKDIDAYVTNSGITITKKIPTPLGEQIYNSSDVYNENGWIEGSTMIRWYVAGKSTVGNPNGSAIRFSNIKLSQGQTITRAEFEYKNVYTSGTGDVLFKCYGIDEDNTADFGGNPMGRTKTSASTTKSQAQISGKFNFGDTWTSLVQEIVDRGGWSSGNAMGFIFNDNGTVNNGTLLNIDVGDRTSSNMELKIYTGSALTTNYKVVVYKDKIA